MLRAAGTNAGMPPLPGVDTAASAASAADAKELRRCRAAKKRGRSRLAKLQLRNQCVLKSESLQTICVLGRSGGVHTEGREARGGGGEYVVSVALGRTLGSSVYSRALRS